MARHCEQRYRVPRPDSLSTTSLNGDQRWPASQAQIPHRLADIYWSASRVGQLLIMHQNH